MATTLHSFIDIFNTEFGEGPDKVQLKKIVIPSIQRDYAQGRQTPDVERVRKRFLDSLYSAVTDKPITLDFVYGDIDETGTMTPLDGQQRLTTLFLLHWYASRKDNADDSEIQFLKNFSYRTRYSARYFCAKIVDFKPVLKERLSKEIINQAWFPLDWKKDPTISSMLVMLDAIQEKFASVDGLWEKLRNNSITFYFLPIKDMGLTDELYIKMNSRGKPLTQFEHFKAELERNMRIMDESVAYRITRKIDREWTDLLWNYRNGKSGTEDDSVTDDEFLRYFKFVCDVLCYRNEDSPTGQSNDEFDLLKRYFSADCPHALENIETLEAFFDCWCNIPGYASPLEFLCSFMSCKHEPGKILVESHKIDIFEDCLHAYSDRSGRIRQFPLNRIVLLYGITVYLQHTKSVTPDDFSRRIRIVNNLIQNSEDEISDRSDRNRMPAILAAVDSIILTGMIDDAIDNSFNVNQINEEKEKVRFLESNPDKAETLFRLEDHRMLRGQISVVGLENLDYTDAFYSLFDCNWDEIDCALMSVGDYGQQERNEWRYQYGSENLSYAWLQLFHRSSNKGFENTKNVLVSLLALKPSFDNSILRDISDGYIAECEEHNTYPFRYYYVKYKEYRPGLYGKLSNVDAKNEPYMFSVLQTKSYWSQNTYMPFLKAADDEHLSKDYMGQRLVFGDKHIICTNDAYQIRDNKDEAVIDTLPISQKDGIDSEDRIVKLREYIATNLHSPGL